MSSWQGKSRGNAFGFSIFVFILKKLGLPSAYFLLRIVCFYFIIFGATAVAHSYRFFRKRIKYTRYKSVLSVYRNFFVFGQTLIDKIAILSGAAINFNFKFEGEEHIRSAIKNNNGILLFSAHCGNWEIAGHLLERLKAQINIVMFDGEHQRIKAYLEKTTENKKFKVITIASDMNHVYEIASCLDKGEIVCLHADRFLDGNKTNNQLFFGETAAFPEGPFVLAAALGVPTFFVFAFREKRNSYHLYCSPVSQISTNESKREFVKKLNDEYVKELQNKMIKYPLQWFNYYDFWKPVNAS